MAVVVLLGCEKETIEINEEQTQLKQIDFRIESTNQLFKQDNRLKKAVDRIKTNSVKTTTSSIYNFGIYENKAQVLEHESYTQYTFEVYRDSTLTNTLENYVLKIYDDDSVEQFLVKYATNPDSTYSYTSIETINDPDLVVPKTTACTPELVDSYEQTDCTPIYCSIHPDGSNCTLNNPDEGGTPISYDCITYTVYVYEENCGSSTDGGSSGSTNPSNTGGDMPIGGGNQGDGGTGSTLPQDLYDWINGLNDCTSTSIGDTSTCNQELYDEIIQFLNENVIDDNNQRKEDFLRFVKNINLTNPDVDLHELVKFYDDEFVTFTDLPANNQHPTITNYDDVDIFFNSLTNEAFTLDFTEIIDDQNGKKKDVIKIPISNFPEATLVVTIIKETPDNDNDNICDSFEIVSIESELEGITSLFDWEQTTSPDSSDPNGPEVSFNDVAETAKIEFYGNFTTGLKIFGEMIRVTRIFKVYIYYDLVTGELKHNLCYWIKL